MYLVHIDDHALHTTNVINSAEEVLMFRDDINAYPNCGFAEIVPKRQIQVTITLR